MKVLRLSGDGPPIASERDLTDLVGEVLGHGADVLAIPIARLDPRFFDLRSGLAGTLFQKASNYRFDLAIVGDVTPFTRASKAFHDLVVECAGGDRVAFIRDEAELERRFAPDAIG